jgi:inorganic pyrophosphatase
MDDPILVYNEISKNSNIKYEYDHELNSLICDRILFTPFQFPFNYGFIPNTLSGDGDPLDAIIYMDQPLISGCYIKCRIIGCLDTCDEKGQDHKLIVVPINKVSPMEEHIKTINDLPKIFIEKVKYFYKHYKDLENKQVTIGELLDKESAYKIYESSKI